MTGGRPPGPLGTDTSPGPVGPGPSTASHHSAAWPTSGFPAPSSHLWHRAGQAAHSVSVTTGVAMMRHAVGDLIGAEAFTCGVMTGMVRQGIADSYELVKLFKTLALAEYWETRHTERFWDRFRSGFSFFSIVETSTALAAHFWPDFDHEAHKAHDDRAALFEGLQYAFAHPAEVFGELSQALLAKYQRFQEIKRTRTLAADFNAGYLLGELLFDVLMTIDAAAGVAKLLAAVPRLARMEVNVARLVSATRRR